MKIALVSCTKLKQEYSCEAKDMYLPSQLFRKARNYIEKNNYDNWFILSAKYGLLKPTDIIEPYNITLNTMKKDEIIRWSYDIFNILSKYNIKIMDFYCGEKYRRYLIPLLKNKYITCNIPMESMGIGQQLRWLNKNIIKGGGDDK